MCRVHCNAKMTWGNAKGTNGRVIEDNAEVFTSAERITDARPHGGTENYVPPIDSRYPLHIPYELCTLTKYHG
jgi:hypothetical protein